MKTKLVTIIAVLLSVCVNPISIQATTPEKTPGAVVMAYLSTAGALDPSATKLFLSETCKHDIITEFKAQRNSGWSFIGAAIIKEEIEADVNKATVKADVDFEAGKSIIGRYWTFFLVSEDEIWKISGMDPVPRK